MLTHFQSGHASPLLRAFTRLMAFVCLWMGTVSVAHHTDEIAGIGGASQSATVTMHAVTPHAPDTPCVACEWLLSLMPRLTANTHVTLTPASRIAFAAPAVRLISLRPVRSIRLRGPPTFLDVSAVD